MAFDDSDGNPHLFDDLSVIGRVSFRICVTALEIFGSKDLWRLSLPKPVAGDCFDDLVVGRIDPFDCSSDGRGENRGSVFAGLFDDLIEALAREAGASRVVDRDQGDPWSDPLERIANALGTFLSAQDDFDSEKGQVPGKFLLHHRLVFHRDGHDDLSDTGVVGKQLGAVLPNGFPVDGGVDLFLIRVFKAGAPSGGGQDDSDVFHRVLLWWFSGSWICGLCVSGHETVQETGEHGQPKRDALWPSEVMEIQKVGDMFDTVDMLFGGPS